ncbi:MAG: hypothetical protein H6925_01795 [Holosporaceae bacterium]|nr:MAG: hypothetical protein H6925_01795 [Holosporaceae bacterium]
MHFSFLTEATLIFFEGRIEGELVWPTRGSNNMSFDPIFMPNGYKKPLAK